MAFTHSALWKQWKPHVARYNSAAERAEIAAQMRSRIDRLLAGFPESIREDYEQTRPRQVKPTAAGNFPSG